MCRTLLILFLCAALARADQNEDKVLRLMRTPEPIKIDGVIEPAWTIADSAIGFFQQQPFHARPPSCRTVASVLTTDEALYCLIVCYDRIENIQRFTGLHDQQGGDMVSIMLDTFNDRQTAYKFGVTSTGVRSDSRMLDDARNRDYSWDAVWFADAEIYEWGYVVEIKIPYRSIRYDKELNEWGIDFDRWIPTTNEDLYWCEYEENEGQRISKFGTLQFQEFRPSASD
ncbi:MAG: carbohydrate binding family 9 domain-containing protein [Bacteroidota bacterium]